MNEKRFNDRAFHATPFEPWLQATFKELEYRNVKHKIQRIHWKMDQNSENPLKNERCSQMVSRGLLSALVMDMVTTA